MDYYALAEELVRARAGMSRLKLERQMSRMMRGEFLLLNYLLTHNNRAYPKELSKAMMVSTARIAALLKHVERHRWITRTPDAQDNRQVIVTLTEEGLRVAQKHCAEMMDHVAQMLEMLGPEDAREYVRIQKKLVQIFAQN